MDIENLLTPDTVLIPMGRISRTEAFKSLVNALSRVGCIQDSEAVIAKLEERENIGPTGLGHGVAVPHARCEGIPRVVLAIGVSPEGLDYDSGDGEPVSILVVILAPQGDMGAHVLTVAQMSRILHDEETRRRVIQAGSPEEVVETLRMGAQQLAQKKRKVV